MRDGRRGARVATLCALAAAVFLAGAAAGAEAPSLRPLVKPGEKAPRFALNDLEGNVASFRPGDGKPALVVFWSAFCPLCREITPSISGIVRRHSGKVRVYSINLDGKRFRNAVTSFVKQNAIAYPVLLDDVRDDFFIASDPYGVEKTPTVVLVDGAGTVRAACVADATRGFFASFDDRLLEIQKKPRVK